MDTPSPPRAEQPFDLQAYWQANDQANSYFTSIVQPSSLGLTEQNAILISDDEDLQQTSSSNATLTLPPLHPDMTLTLPLYLDDEDYSIPSWLSDVLPSIDLLESPVAVQEGLLKNHPGGKRLDLLPRYPVHQPAKRLELI